MRRMVLLVAVGLAAAGCAPSRQAGPPTLRYGQVACASCGMLVAEDRFAAAAVTGAGMAEYFDDIGCLLRYRAELRPAWRQIWVHDYDTGVWLAAEAAFYLRDPALATPMGSGLIALATLAQARRYTGAPTSQRELLGQGLPLTGGS